MKDIKRENRRLKKPVADLTSDKLVLKEVPMLKSDEAALRADIIAFAIRYSRRGYRCITAMLHAPAWQINYKRVERIWQRGIL
jgi:hypothetical protein